MSLYRWEQTVRHYIQNIFFTVFDLRRAFFGVFCGSTLSKSEQSNHPEGATTQTMLLGAERAEGLPFLHRLNHHTVFYPLCFDARQYGCGIQKTKGPAPSAPAIEPTVINSRPRLQARAPSSSRYVRWAAARHSQRSMQGQHLIEYAIVVALVSAAVIAMSTYVFRSAQATQKMIEEELRNE